MKKILSLFIISFTFVTSAIAHEPTNLAIIKQSLVRYHDTGAYNQDVANVTQKAMRYLDLRLERDDFQGKKPAIVLDIDETSLSNYPAMYRLDFGGTKKELWEDANKGLNEPIRPTLKLFRYAKAKHVAVFFLTGRNESEREVTAKNLATAGFVGYDKLILRDGIYQKVPAAVYKTAKRKEITAAGYVILLNIGDQWSDLRGGYAEKTFKLPNPYYLIP